MVQVKAKDNLEAEEITRTPEIVRTAVLEKEKGQEKERGLEESLELFRTYKTKEYQFYSCNHKFGADLIY